MFCTAAGGRVARTTVEGPGRSGLRIMWYNVENFYHPGDDPGQGDDDFTPEGVRRWSYTRYRSKLTALSKVIIAAGGWDPPEVVGLCEVENATVLEELVRHPILAPYGYRFLHCDSPDPRGMDVACLYREERFRLSGWSVHPSKGAGGAGATRHMLQVTGTWGEGEHLELYLVHLVSRFGGAGATAEPRRQQVEQLLHLADSLRGTGEKGITVLAGDFNAEMEGYSMEPLRTGRVGDAPVEGIRPEGSCGSYKYRGRWSNIDHFVACGQTGPYQVRGFILQHPFLLVPDESYGGMMPRRTYTGYLYSGGISDHLPLLLDLVPLASSDPVAR